MKTLKRLKPKIINPPGRLLSWCHIGVHASYVDKAMLCPGTPQGQKGLNCACVCHNNPDMQDHALRAAERRFLLHIVAEGRIDILNEGELKMLSEYGDEDIFRTYAPKSIPKPIKKLRKKITK